MAKWKEDAAWGWYLLSWQEEVQWFATKESGGQKRTLGGRLDSMDRLIATIRNAYELGWNLYLQANPSRRAGKVKLSQEDITHWRYIVLDLDPSEDTLAPPLFDKVAHRIFSGRGYQCWVPVWNEPKVDKIYLKTGDDPARYERIMAGYIRYHSGKPWTNGWQIDTSCSDLARVVRCPGSINQKTGAQSVVEYWQGEGKSIGELFNLECATPERAHPLQNSTSLSDVLPHLTATARKFILDGVESPGRHSACFHTAKLMKELAVPESAARRWVMSGANICRPHDNSFVHDAAVTLEKVYATDTVRS